ncbi:hypothetical protein TNCV_4784211 [Trichonephila clavipes]|nr:hypothetical protein TNCV_4784211 [Trichonephila clavipes]
MIASRNVRKIWKGVVLYHVLKELTLPTGLCFPASREGAGGRSVNRRTGMKKRMETARQNLQPEQLWKLKQEPALITDPNSDAGKCI